MEATQGVLDSIHRVTSWAVLQGHGGHWVLRGAILGMLWEQRLDKWAEDCRGGNFSETTGSERKRGGSAWRGALQGLRRHWSMFTGRQGWRPLGEGAAEQRGRGQELK